MYSASSPPLLRRPPERRGGLGSRGIGEHGKPPLGTSFSAKDPGSSPPGRVVPRVAAILSKNQYWSRHSPRAAIADLTCPPRHRCRAFAPFPPAGPALRPLHTRPGIRVSRPGRAGKWVMTAGVGTRKNPSERLAQEEFRKARNLSRPLCLRTRILSNARVRAWRHAGTRIADEVTQVEHCRSCQLRRSLGLGGGRLLPRPSIVNRGERIFLRRLLRSDLGLLAWLRGCDPSRCD